jgi:F-type H+-transporting ATPase subunit epsilon
MLPEKIQLEIVTPQRRVVDKDVDEVILPGQEGSFGVLPGHAGMLARLAPGVARARGASEDVVMAISSGFAEISSDRVIVLAETCEKADEIDEQRARQKVEELERQVREGQAEGEPDMIRFRIMKHMARISASHR